MMAFDNYENSTSNSLEASTGAIITKIQGAVI